MGSSKTIFLIFVVAFFLRSVSLDQSFWLDEAAQATLSAHNLLDINWAADFQPPLFYILTYIWQKWGIAHEWFLRLPSVFFGVGTIYILHRLVRNIGLKNTDAKHMARAAQISGLPTTKLTKLAAYASRRIREPEVMTALLLTTSPFHIYFSQEYRMYSFFTFLVTLSWYLLYRKMFREYAITVTLMLFTHYFGVLVLASQVFYTLLFQRQFVQQFSRYLAFGIAPFILWLPILLQQFKTSQQLLSAWPDWSRVTGVGFWKFPGLLLAKFSVGMTSPEPRILYAGAVLIVGLIFVYALFQRVSSIEYLVSSIKNKKILYTDRKSVLFLFWFFVPTMLAWLSGFWISANSPHRLLFVLPAFYAITGLGLAQPRRFHLISLILFLLLLCSNIYFSATYLLNSRWHREDWRSAAAYTDQKVGRRGVVLTEYTTPWAPMIWYSRRPNQYLGATTSMNVTTESIGQRLSPFILNTPYFILYTYLTDLSDPQHRVEEYLTKNGYRIIEEKDFRGVGIVKSYKR